ncbi:MAG: MarR family transcriptional regulator [Anaerolineae bacterium]|uniref:MarR family winged helix-turn-helix transcriptional regulator n=1 Tax=Promineifilum sp. TaxID=2664178 RepID=UPI001D5F4A69|nr:MarR family transcriptional regulator [Anaerolineales bacterium]MCB8936655.1 MarR family transcriptional regulator [Promineifilum sp.]MCO5181207.1 MarR family transcriptional regulator [Promineifilum sp.]MCW5847987.1 MarR family transcriptional regulator [Anaerolineae bacterium]
MATHYAGTAAERQALDTFIKLSRAAESVNRRVNDHLRAYDLSVSQFGVLEALYHLGPLPVGQVADKILRSSANLTLVVDNLVKRGLVVRERRANDRRTVEISLTDGGRALIAAIMPAHVTGVVDAFAPLSPDEQATLAALCRKLGLAAG